MSVNGVSPFIMTSVVTPDVPLISTPQATTVAPASTLLRINVAGTQYKDAAGNIGNSSDALSAGGDGGSDNNHAGTGGAATSGAATATGVTCSARAC